MENRTALYRAVLATAISLVASTAFASPASPDHGNDHAWLRRILTAREAALTHAYNTCNLHALRASMFAGTATRTPGGRRVDPVIDAHDRVCSHLRREVTPGSLSVRAVGDDSALVSGRQRYCAIDGDSCVGQGQRFIQLWTLDHGRWLIGWMKSSGGLPPPSEASTAAPAANPEAPPKSAP